MSIVPAPGAPSGLARVLIVDDTLANLRLMHVMLRGLDIDITTASSGAEALAHIQVHDFAVILLDVRMPDMDGYETATHVRHLERGNLRLTPIIFVTAEYQADVQVRKGYTVGAVDYMLKPIVREILVAKVMFFVELFDTRRQLHQRREQEHQLSLIRRELEFASGVQRSILPPNPSYEGLSVFARLETAREVGGDFYDTSACHIGSDKRFCAVIGDVMGKGMPAALVMVLALTVLREATRLSGSPQEILTRANRIMYDRLHAMQTSNLVTAACISLDVEKRLLYYARAGHDELMMWSHRRREVVQMSCQGHTLGLAKDSAYEELTLPVEAGDKVILYTDGITEARNGRKEFFTEERLVELVGQFGAESVDALGQRIFEAASTFQEQALRDDIALLVVEVL